MADIERIIPVNDGEPLQADGLRYLQGIIVGTLLDDVTFSEEHTVSPMSRSLVAANALFLPKFPDAIKPAGFSGSLVDITAGVVSDIDDPLFYEFYSQKHRQPPHRGVQLIISAFANSTRKDAGGPLTQKILYHTPIPPRDSKLRFDEAWYGSRAPVYVKLMKPEWAEDAGHEDVLAQANRTPHGAIQGSGRSMSRTINRRPLDG